MHYELQPNITKKDIVNLQNEMQSLLDKIHKFPLDSITDEDFVKLKAEIAKANLNNLLKYDLSIIRNDLQNKYHAELEVMREDSENKFDEFRLQYENKIQTLDGQYQEEVENLKIQLEDMQKQNVSLCSAVQEVVSLMLLSVSSYMIFNILHHFFFVSSRTNYQCIVNICIVVLIYVGLYGIWSRVGVFVHNLNL